MRALELNDDDGAAAAEQAIAEGRVRQLGARANGSLTSATVLIDERQYRGFVEQARRQVAAYHSQNPLRRGMPREEVRSRLGLDGRTFDLLVHSLEADGELVERGGVLALPNFAVRLTERQQDVTSRFLAAIRAEPHSPPAPDEFGLDRELLGVLEARGDLVQLTGSVVFDAGVLERVRSETLSIIERDGTITLAAFRDHFGTSRKYAQAVLEYFDEQRVTRRAGDERVRGSG
jgi:selenocysteine-specific elongation factor